MLPLVLGLFLALAFFFVLLKLLKGAIIRALYKRHPGFKKIRPFLPF